MQIKFGKINFDLFSLQRFRRIDTLPEISEFSNYSNEKVLNEQKLSDC
jgi:hypothetical protein